MTQPPGKRLKELRRRRGLTLHEVGYVIDGTAGRVIELEDDYGRPPTPLELLKLARGFGLDPAEVLGWWDSLA